MAFALNTYVADGSTTTFAITFPYLLQSHVKVTVAGVVQNLGVNYNISGSNVVFISGAPAAGVIVGVSRDSSQASLLTTYADGTTITSGALNTDSKQAFYIGQEALDQADSRLGNSVDGLTWDAENRRIAGVATPTSVFDAAPKGYVDSAIVTAVGGTADLIVNSVTAQKNTAGGATSGALAAGVLGYTDTGVVGSFSADYNSYSQVIVGNRNSGASASSNFVVGNALTTASSFYGKLGMNSNGWTGVLGTNSLNAPNAVYVTATGAELVLGTTTANNLRISLNNGPDVLNVTAAGVWGGTGVTAAATTGGSTTVLARSGDYGFGRTAWSGYGTDFTVNLNESAVYRVLNTAVSGPGINGSVLQVGHDGTPTMAYLAFGQSSPRLLVGWKASAGATPTWREFAPLASPTFTGTIGIGGISATYGISVAGNQSGGTTAGAMNISSTIQSGVTATSYGVLCSPSTQAATFTLTNMRCFQAGFGTVGAGSTITNGQGFIATASLGTTSTNSYGFVGEMASGANKWNFYSSGTAQNYFLGNVGIGTGKTVPTCALDVNGLVAQSAANALTAAGTNLATAFVLTAASNVVSTVAAGTGVALPNSAAIGTRIWVFNNQGTNALLVYPPTGTVNGAASHSLAANGKMFYVQVAAGVWFTMS